MEVAHSAGEQANRRCRVLVVDDMADLAATLALLIETLGPDVRSTTRPHEAVKMLASFDPDVAILDICMPGLNGWELAAAIRSHPMGQHVFLVALSGLGEPDHHRMSRDSGFNEHWVKPVDMALLTSMLASNCGPGRSTRTP